MDNRTAVSSKWTKTKLLTRSALLNAHIPQTRRLSEESLKRMLRRYGMVYVKPDTGSCGVGVMKLEQTRRRWIVHSGARRRTFPAYRALFRWLCSSTNGRPYLAQRGVRVIRWRGRPIDFRVMIQKGGKTRWTVTGTAARVAPPRKAVTNGSQGGAIYGARTLLRRVTGTKRAERTLGQFTALARATAARFSHAYPRMRELGLDIAVDRTGKCWVLEVNTHPDPCPFTKLSDKAMLRRIVRYARGYGRCYDLRCRKARRGGG
jgi:glutathione synthase/RimK-type ligase-like ATP-grasp enzyme